MQVHPNQSHNRLRGHSVSVSSEVNKCSDLSRQMRTVNAINKSQVWAITCNGRRTRKNAWQQVVLVWFLVLLNRGWIFANRSHSEVKKNQIRWQLHSTLNQNQYKQQQQQQQSHVSYEISAVIICNRQTGMFTYVSFARPLVPVAITIKIRPIISTKLPSYLFTEANGFSIVGYSLFSVTRKFVCF